MEIEQGGILSVPHGGVRSASVRVAAKKVQTLAVVQKQVVCTATSNLLRFRASIRLPNSNVLPARIIYRHSPISNICSRKNDGR
jgi:hypothetical protein